MSSIKKVAVIGTGVIGTGWIIRCLAHNKIVYAFDKDPKLIDKGLWDGVVDTVGGKILANAIVQTNSNGIVAVCGNASTNELNTNVIPFMLRGIKLWGMDSANCSIKRREFIWGEAAKLIDFSLIEKSIQTVSLEELIETYPKILKGEISGRVLVDLNK